MKIVFQIFVLVSILSVLSCKSLKKTPTTNSEEPELCEPLSFMSSVYADMETDYYSIDSLFISGNCLNIWASYSGGCGNSEFKLLYDNKIIKSTPPSAILMLTLDDDDNCRAVVQQKLYYDLSFFEEEARDKGIVLKLAGIQKSLLFKSE